MSAAPTHSSGEATEANGPSEETLRARRLVLGTMAVYCVALIALVSSGHFAFFPKEVLIPLLLIPAALSGQLRVFVSDWGPFVALIVLFDALRGLIFALTASLDRSVFMTYAIDLERALFGGEVVPIFLQNSIGGDVTALEKFLVTVHASHFVAFFVFGLVVWAWRRDSFPKFRSSMLLVCFGGLIVYYVVPTIPPWMASQQFGVLPEVDRSVMSTYNTYIPAIASGMDTNPIAAMPSLHCAIPTLMSIMAIELFGLFAAPVVLYTGLVYFMVVFAGEHYLVDVLAGILLASLSWAVVRMRERMGAQRQRAEADDRAFFRHRIALVAVIALVVVGVARTTDVIAQPWQPSDAFAHRELVGRSPVASLVLGRNAFERGEFAEAARQLDAAPREFLAEDGVHMLAVSHLEVGSPEAARRVLDTYVAQSPTDAGRLRWRRAILRRYGALEAAAVTTPSTGRPAEPPSA